MSARLFVKFRADLPQLPVFYCLPILVQGKVKHYVFVGSAGAYAANSVEPMHVEGDKRKSSAGVCPASCAYRSIPSAQCR